jgi:hypothetical protein
MFEHNHGFSSSDCEKRFGKRYLCARFDPHSLTLEQKDDRVTFCQDIIAMADADKHMLNKIITRNGTWCFGYFPENATEFRMG